MKKEQLRKKWRRSFVIALTAAMVVNSVVPGTIAYAAEFTAPDSEDEIVQEATQEDSAQTETTDVFGDEETVEMFSDNPAEGYAANGTETTDLTNVKDVELDWGKVLPTEDKTYKAGEGTVTWDALTKQLTFENATINYASMSPNGGIQLCGNVTGNVTVTVMLKGDNLFINNDDKKTTTGVFFSMNSGTLKFKGEENGSLTMKYGGKAFSTNSGSNLIFDSGNISADIKSEGISAQGDVTLNGGSLSFTLYGTNNIRGIDQYRNCKFTMNGGELKIKNTETEVQALSGGIIPISNEKTSSVEIHAGIINMNVAGKGIYSQNEILIDRGAQLGIEVRGDGNDAILSTAGVIIRDNTDVSVFSEKATGIQALKEVSGQVKITARGDSFGVGWKDNGKDCIIKGNPVIISQGGKYGGFASGNFFTKEQKKFLENYKLTVSTNIDGNDGKLWDKNGGLGNYKYIKLESCSHKNAIDNHDCTKPVICPDCQKTTREALSEHKFDRVIEDDDDKLLYQCSNAGCNKTKELKKAGTLVTVENYSGEYDGKIHGIKITPKEGFEDVNITYLDSNKNKYKDVTGDIKTVNYKIERDGYATTTGQATVEIKPRTVNLNWKTSEFIYNGENQVPVAEVENRVGDEECFVTVEGAQCDVSDQAYTATATVLTGTSSANYKLPEPAECKHEFKILPKEITNEMAVININGDSIEGFEAVISDNIGGKKVQLEENTDYTINVEKNNDKYNAIIAGTGNYAGQISKRVTSIKRLSDGNITFAVIINPNVEGLSPSLNPIPGDKAESIFKENLSDSEDAEIKNILINKPDGSSYNATFYLRMEAKNESEIPDDVNKIKNFITDRNSSIPSDAEIGKYLDLSLFASYIAKDINGTYSRTVGINDLKDNVQYVTISIPDNLRQTQANTVRSYYMIRVHGDEISNVQCTQNGNTLTFIADKFSTYAIAYKDTYYAPSYPVTSIKVSPDTLTLTKKGETAQLTAEVTPSYADNKRVTWQSSDEKVATVDENGKVTAVGNGTATITATSVSGSYTATVSVTVKIPVEIQKLTIEAEKETLTKIGESTELKVKIEPENADLQKLIWKSDNEKVAIVNENGKVTAVGNGTAEITVTTEDGKITASIMITVKVPDEPTINKSTGFRRLRARSVKQTKTSVTLQWNIIKDADGYFIYGNRCNTSTKSYKYRKLATITGGDISTWTQKDLKKGTYYKYVVKAYRLVNGKKVVTDTSISVHAVTGGGKYGNAKAVSVTQIGNKKNVSKITLKMGKTAQIKAKEVKKDKKIARHRKLCYESSNTKVATVTPDGLIRATGKGTCTIWVYAQNGVYKALKITVK
ncbi:MAG: Ig-like domain-containing protein [Blautia wexlerae]|jgi:uncharacterized protein YjdB